MYVKTPQGGFGGWFSKNLPHPLDPRESPERVPRDTTRYLKRPGLTRQPTRQHRGSRFLKKPKRLQLSHREFRKENRKKREPTQGGYSRS